LVNRKKSIALIATALLLIGVTANAAGTAKDYHRYHVICVDLKTKKITYGGDAGSAGCNSPSFTVVSTSGLAAASIKGLDGLNGLNGKDGRDGKDGKTLWNGINDPDVSWGTPGDMFINATTKTLFGPKNLDGTWPAGVSMVGPKGDQGPIGLTGVAGPQGPGGSGPAGPTGATGATGAAGANGTNGTNGLDGVGSSVGFTRSRQANIDLNNADTQWESFIEVVKMSGLGNGKYFFNSSVAINNAAAAVICYVYGGDTGAGSLNAYGMNTSTIAQNGYIQITGANDFISLKCGKTGAPTITVQYPVLTVIKLDTVTVKNG
jgi:hypothetical protein